MLSNANRTNWVNILERQFSKVSRKVLKQCYLHRTMELTENRNVYIIVTVNYCKYILLLCSPFNSYLYANWILDFKQYYYYLSVSMRMTYASGEYR